MAACSGVTNIAEGLELPTGVVCGNDGMLVVYWLSNEDIASELNSISSSELRSLTRYEHISWG